MRFLWPSPDAAFTQTIGIPCAPYTSGVFRFKQPKNIYEYVLRKVYTMYLMKIADLTGWKPYHEYI